MPQNNIKLDVEMLRAFDTVKAGQDRLQSLLQGTNATLATLTEQIINLRTELNEYEIEAAAARAFRAENEIKQLEAENAKYEKDIEKLTTAQSVTQELLENIRTGKGRGNTSEKIKAAVDAAMQKQDRNIVDLRGFKMSEKAWSYLLLTALILIALWMLIDPGSIGEALSRLAQWFLSQ